MLHTTTVDKDTLELLKRLQSDPNLKDFYLVGGTALSLYLGHRISIDLDLFSMVEFEEFQLENHLQAIYSFITSTKSRQTLKGTISDVKIDCIAYPYKFIREPHIEQGIRLASIEDICAMKLVAIAENGSRLKDFLDISFLSTLYSFGEMLNFYKEKYPMSSTISPIKGLIYFDDIRFDEKVILLGGKFTWKPIANRLQEMVRNPEKKFRVPPLMVKSSIIEEAERTLGKECTNDSPSEEKRRNQSKGIKL